MTLKATGKAGGCTRAAIHLAPLSKAQDVVEGLPGLLPRSWPENPENPKGIWNSFLSRGIRHSSTESSCGEPKLGKGMGRSVHDSNAEQRADLGEQGRSSAAAKLDQEGRFFLDPSLTPYFLYLVLLLGSSDRIMHGAVRGKEPWPPRKQKAPLP